LLDLTSAFCWILINTGKNVQLFLHLSAGLEVSNGPLYILPDLVHNTAVNLVKGTVNLKPLCSGQ